ncbi:hypothetical protein BsWGS_24279 [Bradybaena similaris]
MRANMEQGKQILTDAERKEIREAFEILDEDGDGKLSLDDIKILLQSQFMVLTGNQVTDALKGIARDGSGAIEFAEFEKYVVENNLHKPTEEEYGSEMRDAFEMFDKDHNGYIGVQEFKTFMATMNGKMSDEQIMEIMNEADTNGDGKIDFQEFCVYMSKSS